MLQANIEGFFNWGLIEAGYYTSLTDTLSPVVSPGVSAGKVWQGNKRNWVYESGLESSRQPLAVSGVTINSSFYETDTTTGSFAHHINYPDGQVVFNSAINPSSSVSVAYSYKNIAIYDEEVPWFRDIVFDSFSYNQPTTTLPNGVYSLLDKYAVQLPCLLVESVASRRLTGRELGNSSLWVDQDFLFHVITENLTDRNNIVDLITLQKDRSINLYDPNVVAQNNYFALDYKGSVNPTGRQYPQLVDPSESTWINTAYLVDITASNSQTSLPLYNAVIRVTVRV